MTKNFLRKYVLCSMVIMFLLCCFSSISCADSTRTLSGTIHLAETTDTNRTYWLVAVNVNNSKDYKKTMYTVNAGENSFDYSFNLEPGVYYIDCSSYGYLYIDGSVDYGMNDVEYFDLTEESLAGLNHYLDKYETSDSATPPDTDVNLTITMNLAKPAPKDRYYIIYLDSSDSSCQKKIYVQKGTQQFSYTFRVDNIYVCNIAYAYVSDAYTEGTVSNCSYYYICESGVSSYSGNAKTYLITEDTEIEIDEADYYTISGTVSREDVNIHRWERFVVSAQLRYSEYFAYYGCFDAAESVHDFTLNIPKSLSTENIKLIACLTMLSNDKGYIAHAELTRDISELNDDLSLDEWNLAEKWVKHDTYISLPDGIVAPQGGYTFNVVLAVGKQTDSRNLTISEGESTIMVPFWGLEDMNPTVTIRTVGKGMDTVAKNSFESYTPDDAQDGCFYLRFYAVEYVTGKILLPDGVDDEVSVAIAVSFIHPKTGNTSYGKSYTSIVDGRRYANYSVAIISGAAVTNIAAEICADSECLLYGVTQLENDVDFMLVKGRTISGHIKSPDGDEVIIDMSDTYDFNLSGTTKTIRHRIWSDGSYRIVYSPSETGSKVLSLYVSTDSLSDSNIMCATYYYTGATAVSTSYGTNSKVSVTSNLINKDIYVNTGWKITGTVTSDDDAYYLSSDRAVAIKAEGARGKSYKGYINLESGTGPWEFTFLVDKVADTYTIIHDASRTTYSGENTNLCFAVMDSITNVSVNGNTQVKDSLYIPTCKAVVGIVFKTPQYIDTESLYFTSTVQTAHSSFTGKYQLYLRYEGYSIFKCYVPPVDADDEYTVSLDISGTPFVSGTYYVSDQGLVTNKSQATTYKFSDRKTHIITPIVSTPCVYGKVYIPDGIQYQFSLHFSGFGNHYITVYPFKCHTDEKGRFYYYGIYGSYADSELKLDIGTYSLLEPLASGSYYLISDNTLSKLSGSYKLTNGYRYNIDLTLPSWEDDSDNNIIQSIHGFVGRGYGTYTYYYPGVCDGLRLSFSKNTDVPMTINGKQYTATQLAGQTIYVDSDTVTLSYEVSTSNCLYGFGINKISAVNVICSGPGITMLYGSIKSRGDFSNTINPTKINVYIQGGEISGQYDLIIAKYNQAGQYMGYTAQTIDLTAGVTSCYEIANPFEKHTYVTMFLSDDDWSPRSRALHFCN